MSDADEDQPEEILGKRGKKGQKNKPLPETPDEIEALIRRQKRNLRKAWAEGYLTAITAMLKPGDLAVDCGANMGVVTERLATSSSLGSGSSPAGMAKLRAASTSAAVSPTARTRVATPMTCLRKSARSR